MLRSLLLASTLLLSAPAIAAAAPQAPAPAAAPAKNAGLAALFEAYDQAQLALSPISKSYRAIRDGDYGKWDEIGAAADERSRALDLKTLADLRARFPRASLSPEDQLSVDIFENRIARSESLWPYRDYGYVFDQMNGAQSEGPAFLINIHRVDNLAEAEAYVSRLRTLDTYLDQAMAEAKERAALGVLPPKWVFPYVISDARNVISGAPFDTGADNDVFADFKTKVGKLAIAEGEKARLIEEARKALVEDVKPAYERLIALMQEQEKQAGTDDGIWRFKDGAGQYAALLRSYTTTNLNADQIHQLGLDQVDRIHNEMRGIMRQVGFTGTLQQFFEKMRTDPQFYFPNTDAGRQQYLDKTQTFNTEMEKLLPGYFGTTPKSSLQVKRVEPFREKSAGKAFYDRPAPDGSRPGIYYVNLYNMADMPWTEIEALFYHEGIPGHHLQLAVQTELGDSVPPFRRFGGFTAYSEGWGLYAERLGKDMGQYKDPYSDFGRLQLELHRAIRLVVDSGIHHKRWTREQAIKYVEDNSADAKGGIVKAIERYIVYPGQATAYMVGKLKIEELRTRAQQALGDKFDIKEFHDAVLLSGPVPLDLLERNVDQWIARKKAA
ncbi:DUF885 domain-containing protein [Allosphingosinicella flava]|uniref:DUF885 domain-containing protein n=1 Tax=Allosphingosinicella flava TaxID=2771430 RepID=A0A7T2GIV0_9SPHN|nr:DUF885 domain-containing protein [Sphingosinicella flava]QPQ54651.1 DUF885 domain-containing protein [Sphingosinicella flava]